jgi:DNA replication protein DnaC
LGSSEANPRHLVWRRLCDQRYRRARLDNFTLYGTEAEQKQQRRVIDAIREFSSKISENIASGRNLVLFGPPGTGKDHLLAAVMREAVRAAWKEGDNYDQFAWTNGADLFSSARDCIDSEVRTEQSEFRRWVSPTILAISDPVPPFKDDKLTPFQSSFLLRVIDGRYRSGKPTFVTMNVESGKEAEGRLGAQVVDRLRDGALVCHCFWPSFRRPCEEV